MQHSTFTFQGIDHWLVSDKKCNVKRHVSNDVRHDAKLTCAPVSMAFFSSNLGTDVTFPSPMTLIRTLTSYLGDNSKVTTDTKFKLWWLKRPLQRTWEWNYEVLIRTYSHHLVQLTHQWKNWATGMQKYSLNNFDFLALPAMELAMGFEICLMSTSPSLAAGKAPTAMLEPPPPRGLVLIRRQRPP